MDEQVIKQYNKQQLKSFKQGTLKVIASATLLLGGGKEFPTVWVYALPNTMQLFRKIRDAELGNDGVAGDVLIEWRAALDANTVNPSYIKLNVQYQTPLVANYSLLFDLPACVEGLRSVSYFGHMTVIPWPRPTISSAELGLKLPALFNGFTCEEPLLKGWLNAYELARRIQGR